MEGIRAKTPQNVPTQSLMGRAYSVGDFILFSKSDLLKSKSNECCPPFFVV